MTDEPTQETPRRELKPLSLKHSMVIDEYFKCFRKVDAYKRVYPTANHNSAKSAAARLFADDNFLAHLNARKDEIHIYY